MILPRDARGRLALGLGATGLLAGALTLGRGRQLARQIEVEGVPATAEWVAALRHARRPDELFVAGLCFAVAGAALITWALLRERA
ncbi:MAG: hypothetical protein HY275_06685 [Gemmatimonadetes bacterium]|nr:hypothetical protein [Gemmatimonadota bacterium]